jgi:hypothetical protein
MHRRSDTAYAWQVFTLRERTSRMFTQVKAIADLGAPKAQLECNALASPRDAADSAKCIAVQRIGNDELR